MRTVLRFGSTSIAAILLACLWQPAFAQNDVTLIERLNAAIKQHKPSWEIAQTANERFPTPTVRTTLEVDGYHIHLSLSAYASASKAAEIFGRQHSLAQALTSSPSTRTATRRYQNRNVVVTIVGEMSRSENAKIVLAENLSKTDPATIVSSVAEIVDSLILADVKVDTCINELYPDQRPATASQLERFFRDIDDGCVIRVKQGLAAGADANAPDAKGVTPLMRAVAAGHREVTQALLSASANPNAKVGAVRTPPLFLVFTRPSSYNERDLPQILVNQLAILDDLIAAGSSIESTNGDNRTLLLEVARMNYDDGSPSILLKGLIDRGASVSARDGDGRTAIILAVMNTHTKVNLGTLPVLLAAGADVNAMDQSGKVAIDYARERAVSYQGESWHSVVELLDAKSTPMKGL